MSVIELASKLVSLLIDVVGHEKAQQLVSEEAQRRAYALADTVASAREAAEKL